MRQAMGCPTRRHGAEQGAGDSEPDPCVASAPRRCHHHLLHVFLRDLARRHAYGGLMVLRLGAVLTLVVSSPRTAEAVLHAHDHALARSPTS